VTGQASATKGGSLLTASNLAKRYGDVLLFEGVNLILNAGDRVGLVGPNGCGKTTLLRVLIGAEPADVGSVRRTPSDARVGYLPQVAAFEDGARVRDALSGPEMPSLDELARRVEGLAARLAHAQGADLARVERAYAQAVDALAHTSDQLPEHRIEQVLTGLNLNHLDANAPTSMPTRPSPSLAAVSKLASAWHASSSSGPTSSCWTNPPTTWTSTASSG